MQVIGNLEIHTIKDLEEMRGDSPDIYEHSCRIFVTDDDGRIEQIDTPEWQEGSRSYFISNFEFKKGDVLFCYPTQTMEDNTLSFLRPGFYTIKSKSGCGAVSLEGINGWITYDQIFGRVFKQCEAKTHLDKVRQCELEKHGNEHQHLVTVTHRWND